MRFARTFKLAIALAGGLLVTPALAVTIDELIAQYTALGYTDIEIELGNDGTFKIEAILDGVKFELVVDAETGEVLAVEEEDEAAEEAAEREREAAEEAAEREREAAEEAAEREREAAEEAAEHEREEAEEAEESHSDSGSESADDSGSDSADDSGSGSGS